MGSRREEVTAIGDPSRSAPVQAQLGERICPFLGLASDPDTAAAYARFDHRCGLPGGSNPQLSWQNHYCLVAEHVECPRFLQARDAGDAVTATSLVAIPTSSPGRQQRRWVLAGLAVIVMIVAAGVLAVAFSEGTGSPSSGQANQAGAGTHAASVGQRASIRGGSNGGQAASRRPSSTAGAGIAATPGTVTPAATGTAAASSGQTPAVTATPTLTPSPQPTPAPRTTPGPATPTPKPTPTPAKPKPPATYKVKSGDTLTFVAQQFHTTIDAIAQLNKIPDPNVIATGLILKLPAPSPTTTSAAPTVEKPKPTPTPTPSP